MLILFAAVLSAFAFFQMNAWAGEASEDSEDSCRSEIGLASWYGEDFQGKPMSNGEPFDKRDITIIAHRACPKGTKLLVINHEKNRSLVMTVQDHGPNVADRIIDVSEAAARFLGFQKRGTARLEIRVLGQS